MWMLRLTDEFENRKKRFEKKHPNELAACLDNLDTYFKALQEGTKPGQIRFGFMHAEPRGIVAIDQRGRQKLKQTRLYVYACIEKEALILLTIGDKQSQGDDIRLCVQYVDELLIELEAAEPENENH